MSILRRLILAAALFAGLVPAFGQSAPPPVPALPDTERRTSYTISGSTCACSVGFQLFGDSTDYQNWLEVFINGVPAAFNDGNVGWAITSPTGPLSSIPRPITDAVLTFTNAQTGTIQIVGARRPRRVSQFSENRGVAARDLNQALTDIIAQNRETWDKTNDLTGRAVLARPGETLALLPVLASRKNLGACFDNSGNLTSCVSVPTSTFAAGSGILFTGTNPTTISNNIAAGTGISITGTNPLTISLIGGVTAKVADYTLATSDCSTTINASGGPWTLTLPSAAGFGSSCVIQACNTNANDATHHAIRLSGFPLPSLGRLWMGQCEEVSVVSGVWQVTRFPGRFRPNFVPSLYLDPGGSNANDGLISNVSTNAIADLNTCFTILQSEMDLNGGIPACLLTSGAVFSGNTSTFTRDGTGLGVIYVLGNGGVATLRVTTGNVVVEEYDFSGYLIFSNVQFDCSFASSHPCYGLFLHQQSGVDLASGAPATNPNYFNGGGTTDLGVWCDGQCKINSAQQIYFTGSWGTGIRLDLASVGSINAGINDNASFVGNVLQVTGGSQLLWSGTLTLGVSNSASQFLYASGNGSNAIFSTFTLSGSIGGGARSYQVINNSLLCNASATALPGTAGVSTTTGAGNGIVVASGISGTCTP